MPRYTQHLEKAKHDEDFIASFNWHTTPFLDWVITGMFYSALHYVEAYLATEGKHSVDHRARDSDVRRDPNLKGIYVPYNELKNHSVNARYMTTKFRVDDANDLRNDLDRVKAHVKNLIGA